MAKNQDLKKALLEAIDNDNVLEVKSLLHTGADTNAKDNDGMTPLHVCRNANVARLLIDAGADVNAKDVDGMTPLHVCQNADVAKLLIDAGADVNAKNNDGNTPLDICRMLISMNTSLDICSLAKVKEVLEGK